MEEFIWAYDSSGFKSMTTGRVKAWSPKAAVESLDLEP